MEQDPKIEEKVDNRSSELDEAAAVHSQLVKDIHHYLNQKLFQNIDDALKEIHAADIADIFELLSADDRQTLAAHMGSKFNAEILTYLDSTVKDQIIQALEPKQIAKSVAKLESDDAMELVADLKEEDQEKIIKHLPFASRQLLEEGLTFPEDSAGRLMQREFVAAPEFWTVAETLSYLRDEKGNMPEDFYNIFIIDPVHRVIGYVPLSHVVRADPKTKLETLKIETVYAIAYDRDQEDVAYLFRQYNLISAPVVDEVGRLIGVITVDDIVDVIEEEVEEDILSMAGVVETDFHASTLTTALTRIRWLLILLANTVLASMVINHFKGTIDQIVVLAVLMPIVTSMGGNAGIQVVTVAVRALATRDIRPSNIKRVIFKELGIAAINGIVFALLAGIIATLWFGDFLLASVLAVSMVFNLIWAGLGGILIPLLLARYKIDPAVTAGPILATSTDVFGFFIFLGLATIFLV